MADVNINPFSDHDQTDSYPDETGKNIPLTPGGGVMRRSTWDKKHHCEEGKLKKEGSLILTLTVCTRSYLSTMVEPRMQPITITLDARASGFTSKAGMSHSLMMMES